MVSIDCPHCQSTLELEEQHLGRKVRCPDCREVFVPQPTAARAASAVSPPPPKPRTQRTRRRPSNNLPLILIGGLMAFGGFAGAMAPTLTSTPAVVALCGVVLFIGGIIEGHLDRISFYLRRADERATADDDRDV